VSKHKTHLFTALSRYGYRLSLAAILLYNNWILGLVLNSNATWAGATTSELGATDQPWSWAFRTLDILGGALFLLGASALVSLAVTKRTRAVLMFAVAALGLSTIAESLFFPLQCSSALSRLCEHQENLGLVGWQDSFHVIESFASYLLIWLLPLTVLVILRGKQEAGRLKLWSRVLAVFMVLWGIETVIRYNHGAASYGVEQRIFVVLFSYWYWQAIRLARRSSNETK